MGVDLIKLTAIALGGALGALSRYGASNGIYALFGRGFPYGTLFVNVLGSLVMGFLYIILLDRVSMSMEWRAAMQVGFLGAFTTFSTFSIETMLLLENGEAIKAIANIVLSVAFCLAATWVGMILGRQL